MIKEMQNGRTLRRSYSRLDEVLEMPNLIEVQKNSYKWFLDVGLRDVFRDVSAISDYTGNLELSFIDYTLEDTPKYTVEECKERDATFAAPLKVRVRLRNRETEEIKEQEIFMGDFPLMTDNGTFIINGAERVIVSQIVRSPGIYFEEKEEKTDTDLFGCTVIPYRGAWLEYETDVNDIFYVRIDKNRKLPVTSLVRAIDLSTNGEIREKFGEDPRILATLDKDTAKTQEEALIEIYRRLRPGEPPTVESAQTLINGLFFDVHRYDLSNVGRYKFNKKLAIAARITGHTLAMPAADPLTGEIIAEAGENLSRERARELESKGVNECMLQVGDHAVKVFGNGMVNMSLFVDFDPASLGVAEKVRFTILRELMGQFSGDALKEAVSENIAALIPKHILVDDILASINYLNCLTYGVGTVDDIDHLGNRRLRSVGELLQNQFRIGF